MKLRLLPILLLCTAVLVSGCEGNHSRADNAIGGIMIGATTGGVIGGICCGNPVTGIPAGILIGGAVGGVGGLIMPTKQRAYQPSPTPPPSSPTDPFPFDPNPWPSTTTQPARMPAPQPVPQSMPQPMPQPVPAPASPRGSSPAPAQYQPAQPLGRDYNTR